MRLLVELLLWKTFWFRVGITESRVFNCKAKHGFFCASAAIHICISCLIPLSSSQVCVLGGGGFVLEEYRKMGLTWPLEDDGGGVRLPSPVGNIS